MVQRIIRTRQYATERDRCLDADLVVVWQEEHATDVVDSPDLGRIGPVPHHRTGSHRSNGFFHGSGSRHCPWSIVLEQPTPIPREGKRANFKVASPSNVGGS